MEAPDYQWSVSDGSRAGSPDFIQPPLAVMPLRSSASRVPLIVAIGALLVSVVLAFFSSPVASISGYILTPYVVVACLVIARRQDLRKLSDPYYDRFAAKRGLVVLQVLAAVAFVVSVPHVLHLARTVGLWLE